MLSEAWKKSSWPFLRNRVRGEGQRSVGGITYSGSWIGLSFLALKLIIQPFSAMPTSEKQEFGYTVSYLGGNIHWWLASTMEILREFLESSTIHGLTYISTAQVFVVFPLFSMSFLDQISQVSVACHCLSWFHRCWNSDWQVLSWVARESHCHLNHHPPHKGPQLSRRHRLSSKGL